MLDWVTVLNPIPWYDWSVGVVSQEETTCHGTSLADQDILALQSRCRLALAVTVTSLSIRIMIAQAVSTRIEGGAPGRPDRAKELQIWLNCPGMLARKSLQRQPEVRISALKLKLKF